MERIHKKLRRQRAKTNKVNKLFVYLNNYCNLDCSYCFFNGKTASKLNIKKFKKTLNIFLKIASEPSITILGGEPLLNLNELRNIFKISHSKNIPVTVFTNGTLISKSYKELAKKYNVKTVISLDGNKTNNDKLRKFKSSKKSVYQKVVKNLKKLDMIRSVSVNMVLTPDNLDNFSKNVIHLYKLGFNSIGISLDYSANWNNKEIKKLKKEFRKIFSYYLKLLKNGNPYRFLNMYEIIDKARNKNPHPCSNLILSSDGFLYPCDKIISMEEVSLKSFRLKKDILLHRKLFFNKMTKLGLRNEQGFCDIGPYLYLKYIKKLKNKELKKELGKILNVKKEFEKILFFYFKTLIKIPLFRKIHGL